MFQGKVHFGRFCNDCSSPLQGRHSTTHFHQRLEKSLDLIYDSYCFICYTSKTYYARREKHHHTGCNDVWRP
jgi:hypothetical protein